MLSYSHIKNITLKPHSHTIILHRSTTLDCEIYKIKCKSAMLRKWNYFLMLLNVIYWEGVENTWLLLNS